MVFSNTGKCPDNSITRFKKIGGGICIPCSYIIWLCWWFAAVHSEGFWQRHEQLQRSSATRSCHRHSDCARGNCHRYSCSPTPSVQAVSHGGEGAAGPSSQPGGTPYRRNADDRIRESNVQVLWGNWHRQCMKQLVNFLISSTLSPSSDNNHPPKRLFFFISCWLYIMIGCSFMDQNFSHGIFFGKNFVRGKIVMWMLNNVHIGFLRSLQCQRLLL